MYLPKKSSKGRIKEAEHARNNRLDIIKALSHAQITRRDLFKWGIFTSLGALAWKQGLNPFVRSAYAAIPTGTPASPLFGVQPFTQPMPRADLLARNPNPLTFLNPAPQAESNQTLQTLNAELVKAYPGGNQGPIEGRPPGQSGLTSGGTNSFRKSLFKRRRRGRRLTRSTIQAFPRA